MCTIIPIGIGHNQYFIFEIVFVNSCGDLGTGEDLHPLVRCRMPAFYAILDILPHLVGQVGKRLGTVVISPG